MTRRTVTHEKPLDAAWSVAWIRGAAAAVAEHRDELTELDRAIGDGDHGINLDRGMHAAVAKLDSQESGGGVPSPPAGVFKATATSLLATVGGAAGPLLGTAFLRASRACDVDVLSSQANLAGYRAVIEAAAHFGRLLTGQVTAAGRFPPATVYVIGAGVAGLAAIGTAHSLGAIVRGTDVRPEVADQVRSMGAEFVAVPTSQEISSDGYAQEMAADQAALAAALYAEQAARSDLVITTANIPGRRAPVLLNRAAIEAMRPGSVIVDMAAANGGNTELTVPGEVVVTEGGVTIVGRTDLAARLPSQASQLYGQNLVNLLTLMTPERDGELSLDLEDRIIRTITVCHSGELMWPPPPVTVSAAPTAKAEPSTEELARIEADAAAAQIRSRRNRMVGLAAATLAGAALVLVSPAAVTSHYIVLVLSVILGFHVISNVTPALHTPLMSVTNAISGIILLGAISQVGSSNPFISAVAFVAVVLSTVNVFGGFAVTHRMLAMFRKD